MNADRNLLFGILAVQAGFVKSDRLVEAMNAWTLTKERPLGDILKERGDLSAARHDLVAALVAEQLAQHGGDAAASLAALESATPTKDALRAVADADVQASLGATVTEVKPAAAAIARSYADRHGGGRFRIIKPHAKGGLGEVFLAEDGEIKRNVALKEIRSDRSADQGSVGRFVKEAEITGQLEHPGVVPIYGAGTYGDGRPFYAMRFVQGMELKQAIADFHQASGRRQSPEPSSNSSDSRSRLGGLSSPARRFARREFRDLLGRFIDVCQAVAYAHSRGVLHRDLKPGNVMLGKYGETLVVDWGLAKVVGRDDPTGEEATVQPSSGDSGETLPGNVLGTPAYMSPEQAAGKIGELGPATDIYALGAILHCVLTGAPPIAPGPIADVLRRVKEGALLSAGDAPKPLVAVARKAMSLAADARYKSAAEVAAEVERWLADEPVHAFRDPPLAKAARWTRKHPATTAGSAAVGLMVLLGLGVGLAVVGGYNRRLADANGTIIAQRDQLGAINANLEDSNAKLNASNVDLTKSLAELAASRKEVREALDAATDDAISDLLIGKQRLTDKERRYLEDAAKRYEAFAIRSGDTDDALEFQATGLFRVGVIRDRLSLLPEAEAAYTKALALQERLAAANPSMPQRQYDLARIHNNLGLLFRQTGRAKEAEMAFARALAMQERLALANPVVAEYQKDLAGTHNNLGNLYVDTGRSKDAEAALSRGLAVLERLAAAYPARAEFHYDLARSQNNLAIVWGADGRFQEAEAALTKALALQERWEANASVPRHQHELACSHNNLGIVYCYTGRAKEAESAFAIALALREQLVAANPSVPEYQYALATSLHNLADRLFNTKRGMEAEAAYAKALAIFEKLAAANPSVLLYQSSLARSHNDLGMLYRAAGRTSEAEAAYAKALNLGEKLTAEHPEFLVHAISLAGSQVNLGTLIRAAKRPADALILHRRAIALLTAALDKKPGHATAQQYLRSARWGEAEALEDLARHAEAAAAWRETIDLASPAERPQFQSSLAYALARAGMATEAVKVAEAMGASPEDHWNGAFVLSLASVAKGVSAANKETRQKQAVERLRLAKQPAKRMAEDKDLDPLRQREDFKKLAAPAR